MAEVRLEIDLAHPPERVWRAMTDAQLLTEWFTPTDLEPREGSQFTLDPGELDGFLGPVSGELIEVVPSQRMVMLWQGEKLHTRVVWQLAETADGCQLRMVQSGFIGAPATLRRRVLRATFTRLFAECLPGTLDRLAAGQFDLAAGDAPVRAAIPRQVAGAGAAAVPDPVRPAGGGAAPAVDLAEPPSDERSPELSAVTYLRVADAPTPYPPETDPSPPPPPPPAAAAQPDGTDPVAAGQPETARESWHSRFAAIPAWGRALAIGAAAAVLAMAVLASLSQTAGPGGPDGQPLGPEAREGPGMAIQPGASHAGTPTATVSPGGAAGTAPGSAGHATDRAPGGSPGFQDGAGGTGSGNGDSTPGAGGPPESTVGPPPEPSPELTAQLTTSASGLLGLGGREVSVTVSNSGPGDADEWVVTMDVGDQDVTNVSGADYQRNGSRATFTPTGGGPAAGESDQFTFHIPGLVLLGPAEDPTDCQVDGSPCE